MKQLLTFVFGLSALSFLSAQTYQYAPFPKQIGVWHYTVYNDFWQIVGGVNQQYVLDTATGFMAGAGAFFEANKRIFLASATDTVLKYDFNLTLGDSIIADATFGIDTFYVVADDSAGYHGRRQIILLTNSPYYLPTIWVEGIGNISGYGTLWDNFSGMSISGGHGFWCMYADSVSIPCNSSLNMVESNETSAILIYPNPTTGLIFVENAKSDYESFCLIDQLGRKIISGPIKSQIDVSAVPNGLYFLLILGKEKTFVEKVLKK